MLDNDTITFKSGRSVYVKRGIGGIGPDSELFSADDMCELADIMIERWVQFRNGLDRVAASANRQTTTATASSSAP